MTKVQFPQGKTYPIELRDLVENAAKGDRTLLPALKTAFDENSELVGHFGDLVKAAQLGLMDASTGRNLTLVL